MRGRAPRRLARLLRHTGDPRDMTVAEFGLDPWRLSFDVGLRVAHFEAQEFTAFRYNSSVRHGNTLCRRV